MRTKTQHSENPLYWQPLSAIRSRTVAQHGEAKRKANRHQNRHQRNRVV